jgi:hypothetical protein
MFRDKKESPKEFIKHPVSYELFDSREALNKTFHFYVLGCAGDGRESQKEVAKLMSQIAKENNKKPNCIFGLGDSFYDSGVDSELDEAFKTKFYNVYHTNLTIEKIPHFVVPGNHCYDIQRKMANRYGKKFVEIEITKIIHQVKHTFLSEGKESPEKIALYQQKRLDLSNISLWNMPNPYYHLHVGGVEFFMVDSNRIVADYLDSLENKLDANNQFTWLGSEAKKNKETIKFAFMHHPWKTLGKRALHSDAPLYLSPDQLKKLKELGIEGNYNQILYTIMREKQELFFDMIFCAHDHANYLCVDSDSMFYQMVAGGGGGKLDKRYVYGQKEVAFFMEQFGFVSVTVDPFARDHQFLLDIYGLNGHHLQYVHPHYVPRRSRSVSEEKPHVVELRQALISICQLYLTKKQGSYRDLAGKFIGAVKENVGGQLGWHILTGKSRADDLLTYFNGYECHDIAKIVDYLKQSFSEWKLVNEDSLITVIDNMFREKYGLSYSAFIEYPERITLTREENIKFFEKREEEAKIGGFSSAVWKRSQDVFTSLYQGIWWLAEKKQLLDEKKEAAPLSSPLSPSPPSSLPLSPSSSLSLFPSPPSSLPLSPSSDLDQLQSEVKEGPVDLKGEALQKEKVVRPKLVRSSSFPGALFSARRFDKRAPVPEKVGAPVIRRLTSC